MKNRYAAILLGCMLALTPAAHSYAAESSALDSAEISEDDRDTEKTPLLGQVLSISEESVTIALGTMKEIGKENQPAPEDQGSEESDMLELTGEETEIPLTENTEIVKITMGGRPGGGKNPGVGEPPEGEGNPEREEPPEGEGNPGGGELPEGERNSEREELPEGEGNPGVGELPEGEGNPEGEWAEDQPSEMQREQPISLEELQEGDIVEVSLDESGNAGKITVYSMDKSLAPGGGGQSAEDIEYAAANEYSSDTQIQGEELSSDGKDENTVLVSGGASVTIQDSTVSRDSEDSTGGDSSSFYGVGAAILAAEGTAYISGSTISTDADGGAGIFAYGDSTVYVADTQINTEKDTSGGIHAAGGGTLYAWDVNAATKGESSAAIRSDRGGGTMIVEGGDYTTEGTGSPAVYCTAEVAVKDAKLTADSSEAVCIEGLNTLHLFDCDLSGNMQDLDQNDCTWTIIVYQSMSGDSEVGNSTLGLCGGTVTSENGGLLYTTNTECTITMQDVDITYNDESEFFLRCTGNNNERGWGQEGENGADCNFTAISQEMEGDVIWDSISSLDFYLTAESQLTGAAVDDETYAGNGGDGYCNFYLEDGSVWVVTGDSKVSNLYSQGQILDEQGNTVSIVGTDGTVYVEGDSSYTVTVDSYQNTVDLAGATESAAWEDYQIERPQSL